MQNHYQKVTIEQIRAARGLLQWSQEELAKKTKLSKAAINNIERGIATPRQSTLDIIREKFERAGIEFMGSTGVNLAGDKFKAQILEGSDAFKDLFEDIYRTLKGSERQLLVSGLDEKYFLQHDQDYFLTMIERFLKNKIASRLLIKEGDLNLVEPAGHYRWVPSEIYHQMPYFVYGNKYAIILWDTPFRVVLIENEAIAAGYRKLFEANWKLGRKPLLPKNFKVHFHQYEPGFVK